MGWMDGMDKWMGRNRMEGWDGMEDGMDEWMG